MAATAHDKSAGRRDRSQIRRAWQRRGRRIDSGWECAINFANRITGCSPAKIPAKNNCRNSKTNETVAARQTATASTFRTISLSGFGKPSHLSNISKAGLSRTIATKRARRIQHAVRDVPVIDLLGIATAYITSEEVQVSHQVMPGSRSPKDVCFMRLRGKGLIVTDGILVSVVRKSPA